MKLAALIPALDCSSTIAEVVRGTLREVEHALVIDDGSRDDTAAAALAAGARVSRHGLNRGKGAALLTGLRALAADGWTHAVTLDADGQHLAAEIPKLRAEAAASPDAVILGARIDRSAAAGVNRFGNDFADWWVRWAAGQPIADTQCGFRVYPIDTTLALEPVGSRYELETELLIRAARAGMELRSVPVRVHYPPPGERVSHYDGLRDTLRIIRTVLAHLLRLR